MNTFFNSPHLYARVCDMCTNMLCAYERIYYIRIIAKNEYVCIKINVCIIYGSQSADGSPTITANAIQTPRHTIAQTIDIAFATNLMESF